MILSANHVLEKKMYMLNFNKINRRLKNWNENPSVSTIHISYIYIYIYASWSMCKIINFLNKQISFAFNATML